MEVTRILDRKPSWMVRWGIPLVGFVFILILAGTHFIPYATTMDYEPQQVQVLLRNDSLSGLEITFPVSPSDSALIRNGLPVRLVVQAAAGDNPLRMDGKVHSRQDSEGRCIARILVPVSPETQVLLHAPSRVKVQFILGHTTVLGQIFNPMISLIRGIQTNSKQ